MFTDGSFKFGPGGFGSSAGGIWFGVNSSVNQSCSYGNSLFNILQCEMMTVLLCITSIIRLVRNNSQFIPRFFTIFTDNIRVVNLINLSNDPNFINDDFFLVRIDVNRLIQKFLVEIKKLLSDNDDIMFRFKWLKAHTAGLLITLLVIKWLMLCLKLVLVFLRIL